MAKFMFLARECTAEKAPEDMQQEMQAWCEWMENGLKAGWLLDPGDGFFLPLIVGRVHRKTPLSQHLLIN